MFSKLLIANRGEIACRVIRTARRMGIRTVAVYSDVDAAAPHVRMADEAVRLGPAPAAESYLRGDAIIAAARATGAQAIHPGYGFLSENPDFVDAVAAGGLIFVGPPATAIRAMGLKDAAKRLMTEAGVPVVPGYHGIEQAVDLLAAEAERIGYPVLIKAVAGGGGKGMRRVDHPQDLAVELQSAAREAQAAFGNPAVLIEKFIENPRHIEIQVFADGLGNTLHLFERDCSLQRRHQKVIEEAPAPGMAPGLRAAMGAAAVKAAAAVSYCGAGTVEFIVDGQAMCDGREDVFWFMEMNTRLQVEHPVTEAITGLDLVEWQLRVAAGEALPATQQSLAITGHAVEARLYAETPENQFLPAIGRLERLRFPGSVRVDSGVVEGDEVTPHYDPMIAKLIATGPTRDAAFAQLAAALDATEVAGCGTNRAFLARLLRDAEVRAGAVETGLIGRKLDALIAQEPALPIHWAAAALAALNLAGPVTWLRGFHLWQPLRHHIELRLGELSRTVVVTCLGGNDFSVGLDDADLAITLDTGGDGLVGFVCDGVIARLSSGRVGVDQVQVQGGGVSFLFDVPSPGAPADEAVRGDVLTAPMPGRVLRLSAEVGATVTQGAVLMVLEAMKMEQSLTAPRDGVIAAVHVALDAQVAAGDALIALEPLDD